MTRQLAAASCQLRSWSLAARAARGARGARGALLLVVGLLQLPASGSASCQRPAPQDSAAGSPAAPARARALGVTPGIFRTGTHNTITDVPGVRVGQASLVVGDSVRSGVTAVLPHAGDLYRSRVPAAIHVGNGFGKLLGVTQVRELGELETPVLLTCTLCVWRAGDALARWMLGRPGMEPVRSINPVVGETNDGGLNATRERPGLEDAVRRALDSASVGPVAEGSVGAGTGTAAFGWKGGIGTSSRVLPKSLGGWNVGILVQSNFGGVLQIAGAPVGKALGRYSFRGDVEGERGDGSIMIVVATDAPLSDRNLERLAARATLGLARTGSAMSNGSGDYVIAFSTAEGVRRAVPAAAAPAGGRPVPSVADLPNDDLSALFQAVVEATEEAILNSILTATTVSSRAGRVEAIPVSRVRDVLRKHGVGAP